MATGRGKKRALSYDSDDMEMETRPGRRGSGKNKSNVDGDGDGDWSTWQEGVRTQEAARVQQYVKTFQRDIIQKAHNGALASLRRQGKTHAQRDADVRARIVAECKWDDASAQQQPQQQPLYVAGCQALELLESTLDQFDRTAAALAAGEGNDNDNDNDNDKNSVASLRSSWDKDLAEARKLLSYGRAYGDGLVRDIIVPAHGGAKSTSITASPAAATSKNDSSGLNATGKAALGMFPRSSTAAASHNTWGEAAHSQMEMLSRLMRIMSGNGGSSLASEKKSVRFDV